MDTLTQRNAPAGVLGPPVPTDLYAEGGLLTALLKDRDAIIHARPLVQVGDFWCDEHNLIYRLVCAAYERREPPDQIVLRGDALAQFAPDVAARVLARLDLLWSAYEPAQAEHVVWYAERVARMARQRRRIQIGGELAGLGFRTDLDSDGAAQEQARILAGLWSAEPAHGVDLGTALGRVLDDLATQQRTGAAPGLTTGFPTLDTTMYGWERGTTNLLGALTSGGKTALALHFARAAAVEAGVPVLILSLEMDANQIARRLLAMESGTDMGLLRTAKLGEHNWRDLTDAAARLTSGGRVRLLDSGITTVAALQTEVQRAQADPAQGCGLLIVDYLQLLDSGRKGTPTRENEVSAASRELKRLARQCDLPVVVLAQLNDGAEGTDPPQLRDFRESRGPAMDATVVLALHRPDPVNTPRRVDLYILKNRDGERHTGIALDWQGNIQRFTEARR